MGRVEAEEAKAQQALLLFLEQFPYDPAACGFVVSDGMRELPFVINQKEELLCRKLQALDLFLRALSSGQKIEIFLLVAGPAEDLSGSEIYPPDSIEVKFLWKHLVGVEGDINPYLLAAILFRDIMESLEEVFSLESLKIEKETIKICV